MFLKEYFKNQTSRAMVLATMASAHSAYADQMPYPLPEVDKSFHQVATPACRENRFKADYISTIANHTQTAQPFIENVIGLSHNLFPDAFTDQNVTPDAPDKIQLMQQMLMRVSCYQSYGRKDDGAIGPETQAAIQSFVHTHKSQYPDLEANILYDEEHKRQIMGVKPNFMEALAFESAKAFTYQAELFRAANTHGDNFNGHSYALAVFKEARGDNLGKIAPDYEPLPFTIKDTDIAARTVYGEARGENQKGQIAVAYSMVNRSLSHIINPNGTPVFFKPTVQETVLYPYQYSTWNDNDPNKDKIEKLDADGSSATDIQYREIKELVRDVLHGNVPDPTNGADHYHVTGMSKDWSEDENPVAIIEGHKFYSLYPEVAEMRKATSEPIDFLNKIQSLHKEALTTPDQAWQLASLEFRQ